MRRLGKIPYVLLLAILFVSGCGTPPSRPDEAYLTAAVAQAFWFSETPPADRYPTGVADADRILSDLPGDVRSRVILRALRSIKPATP